MSNLPFELYHIRKIKPEDILDSMRIYYPEAMDLFSYSCLLNKDINEFVAAKHRPTFRKNKEYVQIIPRIQMGIKIYASCDKFLRVADIYRKLEANRTRLIGYGFTKWMYDLTVLDDDLFVKSFMVMPDVFASWINNYKHYIPEIELLGRAIARTGISTAFSSFREIMVQAGYDASVIDGILIEKDTYIHYTDDETPGKHEYKCGLITYSYIVRPEAEEKVRKEEPKSRKVHTPDANQISLILAEHKRQRLLNLNKKIKNAVPSSSGLYPHEIAALSQCQYWTIHGAVGPRVISIAIQLAGVDDFLPYLQDLTDRGYLTDCDTRATLSNCLVKELSSYLKAHSIKSSGRKAELIDRIISNIPNSQIHDDFPERYYSLTEKGRAVIDKYPFVSELEHFGCCNCHWYGPRCDLWGIFETIKGLEGLTLSEVASILGIQYYYAEEDDDSDYAFYESKDWPGEWASYTSPDGTRKKVPICPFCDRDFDPYDFDRICSMIRAADTFGYPYSYPKDL